ncbi:MAG: S66 peptidase family protein [Candidatus Binatia bacterium]
MRQEKIKPRALKQGGRVGVVAPAGCIDQERLNAGIKALTDFGFGVEVAEGIEDRKGYLAGDQEKRAEVLTSFFTRDDIEAIFCTRGGFGSIQLIPFLDPETIRLHPKIFAGYSDVSVLLNWLHQSCGFVTFHGPMVAMDLARGLAEREEDFLWGTLSGRKTSWRLEGLQTIRPGKGRGELVGGCLSMIVTMLGTPYEVETDGKVLFLEDVGERPYRIERMLTHLKMAGKLDRIAGMVFGTFTDCQGNGDREVDNVIAELFRPLSYPVISGFPAGHGEENLLLPIGAKMEVDGLRGALSLLEAPVT